MATQEREVSRWVVGLVRTLRWVLWVLLITSVAATLGWLPALRGAARSGRLPEWVSVAPVVLVGAFIAGYAVYRFALVRAGRYPAGKAMVQILLMTLFLSLLVRWGGDRLPVVADGPVDLSLALASADPEVRALAAEVVRARPRPEGIGQARRLAELLSDPSAEVRRQAHASLVALLGRDLGDGPDAGPAWISAIEAER